jgi:hypothetical protein
VPKKGHALIGWSIALPSSVCGQFFYLYAVLDIFSRKLIAWKCMNGKAATGRID